MTSSNSITELFGFCIQDIANRSFLKSSALQETVDNRKLLAEKDALAAKRWDQYLEMGNKYYDLSRERTRETYLLKQQIQSLEQEKKELQERLQSSQASRFLSLLVQVVE